MSIPSTTKKREKESRTVFFFSIDKKKPERKRRNQISYHSFLHRHAHHTNTIEINKRKTKKSNYDLLVVSQSNRKKQKKRGPNIVAFFLLL